MHQRGAALLVAVVMLAFTLPANAQLQLSPAPVIDGYVADPVTGVVEEPYLISGITYTLDSMTGDFAGLLYFYEDADYVYFAFAQSVHLSDNSYGVNGIGWTLGRDHVLKDLYQSDHIEVQLYDTNGTLALDFFLDYATFANDDIVCDGIDGADGYLVAGDGTYIVDASSSLEWNFQTTPYLYPDRLIESPARTPTNTYDEGTTADPASPWIYEQVYEFQIDKAAFGGLGFGDIQILEVHNSPLKSGAINPVPTPLLSGSKLAGAT